MRKKSAVIVNGSESENKKSKFLKKLFATIALSILLIWMAYYTISVKIINKKFAEDMSNISKLNSKTIFSIDKIYLYSSANATENKERRAVWNLNIYQYTDIAIYINNRSDEYFNYENSIKELYIDNIKFDGNKIGEPSLYYKNINEFGKSVFRSIEQNMSNEEKSITEGQANTNEVNNNQLESQNVNEEANTQIDFEKDKITDRLNFSILNDGDIDYSKPQIYADCTNPITLEYVNNNIKENQIISDINTDVTYDGNLLRKSGIILSDIQASISFRVTIVNNYNQEFVANVFIEVPLEDTVTGDTIYNGKFVQKIEKENMIKFLRTK